MRVRAQMINWPEVFTMGLVYPVWMNSGELVLGEEGLVFVHARTGKKREIPYDQVEAVTGWFYLTLTLKSGRKHVFRLPMRQFRTIKRLLRHMIADDPVTGMNDDRKRS